MKKSTLLTLSVLSLVFILVVQQYQVIQLTKQVQFLDRAVMHLEWDLDFTMDVIDEVAMQADYLESVIHPEYNTWQGGYHDNYVYHLSTTVWQMLMDGHTKNAVLFEIANDYDHATKNERATMQDFIVMNYDVIRNIHGIK
jgi:hypothetical protein